MGQMKAKPPKPLPQQKQKLIRGENLDVAAIVHFFGGPQVLSAALLKEGLATTTPVAVYRWIARNKIPGEHLAAIVMLAKRLHVRFNLLNYWTGR